MHHEGHTAPDQACAIIAPVSMPWIKASLSKTSWRQIALANALVSSANTWTDQLASRTSVDTYRFKTIDDIVNCLPSTDLLDSKGDQILIKFPKVLGDLLRDERLQLLPQ